MRRSEFEVPHTLKEWEDTMAGYTDTIRLNDFYLRKSVVVSVDGEVLTNNKWRKAQWSYSGRCYINDKRVKEYDIKFSM